MEIYFITIKCPLSHFQANTFCLSPLLPGVSSSAGGLDTRLRVCVRGLGLSIYMLSSSLTSLLAETVGFRSTFCHSIPVDSDCKAALALLVFWAESVTTGALPTSTQTLRGVWNTCGESRDPAGLSVWTQQRVSSALPPFHPSWPCVKYVAFQCTPRNEGSDSPCPQAPWLAWSACGPWALPTGPLWKQGPVRSPQWCTSISALYFPFYFLFF